MNIQPVPTNLKEILISVLLPWGLISTRRLRTLTGSLLNVPLRLRKRRQLLRMPSRKRPTGSIIPLIQTQVNSRKSLTARSKNLKMHLLKRRATLMLFSTTGQSPLSLISMQRRKGLQKVLKKNMRTWLVQLTAA